jgi:DNA-binding winged helix-turn-helix (wHTH) protein/TolB-like protein/tetratricopeptide (TPR) repeat protein
MQPLNDDNKIVYRFEGFQLDPTRRLLLKEGRAVQLTPKTLDTLLVLVRHRGRVMEKDELMQAIWPDTVVEETNLAHNISALRKIFGQKGEENRFIITVPARGYSFVAEVQQESLAPVEKEQGLLVAPQPPPESASPPAAPLLPAPPPSQVVAKRHLSIPWRMVVGWVVIVGVAAAVGLMWKLGPAPGKPIRSVAVLPFKPLVADSRDEVLEMGIADTLITHLNNLKQITVRPISAVRRYTALDQDAVAAGHELDVQAVLEGNIQKADGKIRVTARLVRIADGKPLWTRQFDEQWTNIFAVQDAISQRVAGDLVGELTGELERNYTTDPEAYQLFLMGRYHWNKRSGEGIRKSLEFFQQAIAKDPEYALAYAGLADAYATLGSYRLALPREVLPLAQEAAAKALQLDGHLAEAHASMGKILTDYTWEWERAEKELRLAIELKPNYANTHQWYAILLAHLGRFDEAIAEAKRAVELDYFSPVMSTQLGSVLYRARQYDEAITTLRKTVDLEPNFVTAHAYLGLCYLMRGSYDEARAEFQRGRDATPNNPDFVALLGHTCARAGQLDQARRYEKELKEMARKVYVSPASDAYIYSAMGEMDTAFKWFEMSFEERTPAIRGLKTDPLNDLLRNDPRYDSLLRRAGFVQ